MFTTCLLVSDQFAELFEFICYIYQSPVHQVTGKIMLNS
jgi:hypothetical protein